MKILITDRNELLSQNSKESIQQRLLFALSRFGNQIDRVNVQVSDVNGPRGGQDKHCSVTVILKRLGSVKASATESTTGRCTLAAIERIGRAVSRKVDRRRNRSRERFSDSMVADI